MKHPFPLLSALSLVSAALFYLVSAPIWHSVVSQRLEAAYYNSEDAREDAGRFSSLDVVFRATMTAVAGALVGLALCIFARRRHEPLPFLRRIAFVGNLLFIGYALYFIGPLRF
jgi:hypothetical protein